MRAGDRLEEDGRVEGCSARRRMIQGLLLLEDGSVAMMTERRLLQNAYAAFNARDIEAALAAMHADVEWPNGMEGGSVHGHSGVRDYWTRQWGLISPHVEPLRFDTDEAGRIVVDVRQIVRDRAGNIMADEMVQHVYLFEDDLVRSMEIRKP